MQKIIREYVDLALFEYALCKRKYNTTQIYPLNDDSKGLVLRIFYSKHVMNPGGFYIGYENYWVDYECVKNRIVNKLILNSFPDHKYIIDLDSRNITFVDGPKSEICQHDHPDCCCDCDLYTSPTDKVPSEIEDEVDYIEREILDSDIGWGFKSSDGITEKSWFIEDGTE